MKFIGKLSLLASLLFSTHAMAFRVIDQKVTTTPGFESKIVIYNQSSSKGTSSKKNSIVSMKVNVKDFSGKVNKFIQLESINRFVVNNSDKNNTYEYIYTLKCGNGYTEYVRHVELSPQETYSEMAGVFLTVQNGAPGDYPIHATGLIKGNGQSASDTANSILRITM